MIPTIGLMIAAYACARLLQVPVEQSQFRTKTALLWIISVPAILVVGGCALNLVLSAVTSSNQLNSILGR